MSLPALSLLDTRVLGVLIEKQHTVPDTYPLTLNALVAGCNQKTSRDPVIDASDADVQASARPAEVAVAGRRVERRPRDALRAQPWARVLGIPAQAVALLTVIMLRGPQTIGELRIHTERLHRFADTSSVEGFLHELAARPAGALVAELPRQPGARETRWAHLLSGPVVEASTSGDGRSYDRASDPATTPAPASNAIPEFSALRSDVTQLQDDVAALRATLDRLVRNLGLPDA